MNKTLIYIVIALFVGGALVYGGSLLNRSSERPYGAVSDILNVGPEIGQNGLNSYVARGDFITASTTLFVAKNPFPATSTVEFVSLLNSAPATSTYNLLCGVTTIQTATTTDPSGSARGDYYPYDTSFSITSLYQTFPSGFINIGGAQITGAQSTAGAVATNTNFGLITFDPASTTPRTGGSIVQKINVSPGQSFGCFANVVSTGGITTAGGQWAAFTGAVRGFAGSFKVRFLR